MFVAPAGAATAGELAQTECPMLRTVRLPARWISRTLLALFALTALRAASCPDAEPPIDELFPCAAPDAQGEGDGACGGGWHCAADQRWLADRYSEHGWCLQDCVAAGDCPSGYVCERGGCVAEQWLDCRGRAADAAPWAEQQQGVCQGARQVCAPDVGRWIEPDYDTLPHHEATEQTCDGLDNDCDGVTDEDLAAPEANLHQGVCAGMSKRCLGQAGWQEPDPSGVVGYEAVERSCDGLDNDCDGATDEGLQTPPAEQQQGVCQGALKVCAGAAGFSEPDYGQIPGFELTEATCDGLDNDCDGATDEALDAPDATLHVGVCAGQTKVCAGAAGWQEPEYGALPAYEADEQRCDGLDNDCDGATDTGIDPPQGDRRQGVCQGALKVCGGAAGWQEPDYSLQLGYEDQEAACDGLDNDCDGLTDVLPDGPDDGDLPDVLARPCYTGDPETRGVGLCHDGTQACDSASGRWVDRCDDEQLPAAETCDGQNNDCDQTPDGAELVDEDLEPPPDATCLAAGVCAGVQPSCAAEQGWICPYPDTYDLAEARCDGLDNDCDGQVDTDDPDLQAPADLCLSEGVCAGTEPRCGAEQGWGCPYPEQSYEAQEQSCDGLDNDCDGLADLVPDGPDEDSLPDPLPRACYGGPDGTEGVGECHAGRERCVALAWGPCEGEQRPVDEACDGLDNDCDEATDEPEELPPPAALLQDGLCAGSLQICAGAQGWQEPDYTTIEGYEPSEGACDGLDNDCDGAVDDPGELPAPLAAQQLGVCAGSRQACAGVQGWLEPDYDALPGYESPEQSCDGLDNDCDGDLLATELDNDGDGVPACTDCDDGDSMVHPGQDPDPAWGANTNQQDRWPGGLPERSPALDLCADSDDWDCSDGGVLREETCGAVGLGMAAFTANRIVAHPSGAALLVGTDSLEGVIAAQVLRMLTGNHAVESGTVRQSVSLQGLAFNEQGDRLYAADPGAAGLWEVRLAQDGSFALLGSTLAEYPDVVGGPAVSDVAFHSGVADAERVVLSGTNAGGPIEFGLVARSAALVNFRPAGTGPFLLARAPDFPLIASASQGDDGTVDLQDLEGNSLRDPAAALGSPALALTAGLGPGGAAWAWAASVAGDLFAVPADPEVPVLSAELRAGEPVAGVAVGPGGSWIFVLRGTLLEVYSTEDLGLWRVVDLAEVAAGDEVEGLAAHEARGVVALRVEGELRAYVLFDGVEPGADSFVVVVR